LGKNFFSIIALSPDQQQAKERMLGDFKAGNIQMLRLQL